MKTIQFTTLETERLLLRPPALEDVPRIVRYAGDPRVALKTCLIPHPYFRVHALEWLSDINDGVARGESFTFAIERKAGPGMIGAIGLTIRADRCGSEVGYWLGVDFWRRGIMTEALRRVLAHAFDDLGLGEVSAGHMVGNTASGGVMLKAGMSFESIVEGGFTRGELSHDLVKHRLSAEDWKRLQT